jgi:hypothetical protein
MKKFETFSEWTTSFADQGCYDHINRMTAFDEWVGWPSCEALQTLEPDELKNLNNKTIQFVPQSAEQDYSAVAYEEYIYETGKVPTRAKSWHDIFGALSWCMFPNTKATINKLHYDDIKQFGTQKRSSLRNALTLFDECGVVLVTTNQTLLNALKQHQWQQVFIEMRDLWHKPSEDGVAVYQFGHANYEMLTKPYIGLTGKWLVIDASAEIAGLPLNVQYRLVDQKLAAALKAGVLNDNSNLYPLPLMGVPKWLDANEDFSFYDNTDYFRPKSDK